MTDGHIEESGVAVGPGRDPDADEPGIASDAPAPQPLSSAEYSVAFTPRNVAIGLAIVAGLVAFALRRRRRGDDHPDDEVD